MEEYINSIHFFSKQNFLGKNRCSSCCGIYNPSVPVGSRGRWGLERCRWQSRAVAHRAACPSVTFKAAFPAGQEQKPNAGGGGEEAGPLGGDRSFCKSGGKEEK